MSFRTTFILIFTFLLQVTLSGQNDTYSVKKASFSSDRYDEFSPVYHSSGIVFCSNRDTKQVNEYSNSQNQRFFKIFYIDTTGNAGWQKARLFSKELKSKLNDGPVTFSADGDTIYFSRNIKTEGKPSEISGPRNKLGVFNSVFVGSEWEPPLELRYNNEWYNITTPSLSPDGKRLFFASDKDGGYGGSDLYYCQKEKDIWGEPVNLGPAINTSGNEAYPFVSGDGKLYFSSDGFKGLGGKDIFLSKCVDSVWLEPVHIDAPINSKYDDFGLITDPVMKSGYFSSNRDGTLDIFNFKTKITQLFYSDKQRINQYTYSFSDDGSIEFDSNKMMVEWDFGNLNKATGEKVDQSFPGPGKYFITETIIDKATGANVLLKQAFELEIKEIEQPFISSPDAALIGETIVFDGLKSYLTGFAISGYFWDFGDGTKEVGSTVRHKYTGGGEYKVVLGLSLKNIISGELTQSSIYKTVKVFSIEEEKASFLKSESNKLKNIPDVESYDHAFKKIAHTAISEQIKETVFQVEILSSDKPITNQDNLFKNLRSRYYVEEKFLTDAGSYSYIVAEEISFMNAYLIYKDVTSFGFKAAIIKTRILTSPVEKDLYNLKEVYGNNADVFFIKNDSRLSSSGYAYIDQVFLMMDKYPDAKLLIESHSDRSGTPALNLLISKQRAQSIMNYLVKRGVDYKRLIAIGLGDTRPLALNSSEEERKKNQRIDIMLIK